MRATHCIEPTCGIALPIYRANSMKRCKECAKKRTKALDAEYKKQHIMRKCKRCLQYKELRISHKTCTKCENEMYYGPTSVNIKKKKAKRVPKLCKWCGDPLKQNNMTYCAGTDCKKESLDWAKEKEIR